MLTITDEFVDIISRWWTPLHICTVAGMILPLGGNTYRVLYLFTMLCIAAYRKVGAWWWE